MRNLTVQECDRVAGGIYEVVVYGYYDPCGAGGWFMEYYYFMEQYQAYDAYQSYQSQYGGSGGGAEMTQVPLSPQAAALVNVMQDANSRLAAGAVALERANMVLEVGEVLLGTAERTVDNALKDIQYFRNSGGEAHIASVYMSVIPWHNLMIPWDDYGALDPNTTNEQVLEAFIQDVND